MNPRESLLPSLASLLYLTQLGFNFKRDCNLVNKINSIVPNGGTKLRDAITISTTTLLNLGSVLNKLGSDRKWNIVHIVLTDGEDTGSQKTLPEVIQLMYAIGKTLRIQSLKTWFIGVDLEINSDTFLELEALAFAGGDNAEFERINTMQIGEIFERIKISLGAIKKTQVNMMVNDNIAGMAIQQQIDPVLLIEQQQFVVLFTLDMSGSMSGDKWRQVCESVGKIIDYLGDEDLIGCVVFNENAKVLLAENRNSKNNNFNNDNNNNIDNVINHFNYSIKENEEINQNLAQNNNTCNILPLGNKKRFPRGCRDWPWYYFLPLVILLAILFFLTLYLIFAL